MEVVLDTVDRCSLGRLKPAASPAAPEGALNMLVHMDPGLLPEAEEVSRAYPFSFKFTNCIAG